MEEPARTRGSWSTRKKDLAPRGVYKHANGAWAIRYVCGAGHLHKERVGRIKSDAKDAHDDRRARARREPGWCPMAERERERQRAAATRAREQGRITFETYAEDFVAWARVHHLSWKKDDSRLSRVLPVLRGKKLDEVTSADIDRFLGGLLEGERPLTSASRNRYRDLLSGMFKRAIRLGLVATNPVKTIPKLKEAGGRVVYLPAATKDRPAHEEVALVKALPAELRPLFLVSVHTGLRWSEQAALRWLDVDVLSGTLTVARSKNGHQRTIPMNAAVRSVFLDASLCRKRTDHPDERVFPMAYRTVARSFGRAVKTAQAVLQTAGRDATLLEGYTWHCNRHTFASRLVVAGVDLLSVQRLGGWRTVSMIQRYAHLAPDHLRDAVERLVEGPRPAELARNYPISGVSADQADHPGMQLCETERTEG